MIDSHRPLNLGNVYDDERVFVFDDGETRATIPAPEDVFLSDSDDSDDDASDGGDGTEARAKRRRTRPPGSLSPRSRRQRRDERRSRLREYYARSHTGVAAAILAWELASGLGRARNDLLWLVIVGLTDHFLHDRIDAYVPFAACVIVPVVVVADPCAFLRPLPGRRT